MKLTLVMADYNLIFISECPIQGGKGTQRAECFPVPWGPQLWLQNLLAYSTAGTTGTTTAGQQVPHSSLSLQVKQLKIPSLNPTGWREGLCRGKVFSLLWAGGFSIVFLQEIFTNLTAKPSCCSGRKAWSALAASWIKSHATTSDGTAMLFTLEMQSQVLEVTEDMPVS